MSKLKKRLLLALPYFFPFVMFAQVGPPPPSSSGGDVVSILQIIVDIMNAIIPVLVILALIYFIYGVVKYMLSQDDESGKSAARSVMINGIIALFVIVSVWGLVNVLVSTFSLDVAAPPVPVSPVLP